jgi:adenosylmethionine-8-amino-7-oxononanoate aminotransferase
MFDRVRRAVADQMDSVSYCHSLFYGTSAVETLANLLIRSTDGEMAKAFFISSGSEAIEAALKLARQYHLEKKPSEPQRTHFIARQQSYHGTTLGALAVGGHLARRAVFEPILSINSSRVSPCFYYRGVKGLEHERAYVRRLEAELDAEFERIGPSRVAAFIAEPVVGAALGCVPPIEGYFAAVKRVCDKHGALLILDEIMCGIGRVGPEPTARFPQPLHAWQDPLIGVAPDIMTMGKGLGGGYMPVAAMLANHKVINALSGGSGIFSHGQTYQGHPLACRAALEVQKVIQEQSLVSNVRQQGALLGRLLKEQLGSHPAVGNIRGKGLFWGIEFVADKETKAPFSPERNIAMGVHELGESTIRTHRSLHAQSSRSPRQTILILPHSDPLFSE